MSYEHPEILSIYEELISAFPEVERKGKTMPYTSLNGNMFSFLDKNGDLSIRLAEDDRNEFIEKFKTKLSEQHGRVMKEYALVPEEVAKDKKTLKNYFKKSVDYTSTLKPKGKKK